MVHEPSRHGQNHRAKNRTLGRSHTQPVALRRASRHTAPIGWATVFRSAVDLSSDVRHSGFRHAIRPATRYAQSKTCLWRFDRHEVNLTIGKHDSLCAIWAFAARHIARAGPRRDAGPTSQACDRAYSGHLRCRGQAAAGFDRLLSGRLCSGNKMYGSVVRMYLLHPNIEFTDQAARQPRGKESQRADLAGLSLVSAALSIRERLPEEMFKQSVCVWCMMSPPQRPILESRSPVESETGCRRAEQAGQGLCTQTSRCRLITSCVSLYLIVAKSSQP